MHRFKQAHGLASNVKSKRARPKEGSAISTVMGSLPKNSVLRGFVNTLAILELLFTIFAITIYCGVRGCWRIMFPQSKDVKDQVVLLTGAGGGLGRQLALRFGRLGARVICVDIATENNEKTAKLVRELTGRTESAYSYTVDLSKRTQVTSLLDRVCQEHGQVDILVANAGVIAMGLVSRHSDTLLDAVVDVNLKSTMWLVRGLLPGMRKRNAGHLVAISSASAYLPIFNFQIYGATKAGITSFMGAVHMELELEKSNIKVTTVHPYIMDTFELATQIDTKLPAIPAPSAADTVMQSILSEEATVVVPRWTTLLLIMGQILPREVIRRATTWFQPIEDIRDLTLTNITTEEGEVAGKTNERTTVR